MEAILTPDIIRNLIYRFKELNPNLKGTSAYECYRETIIAGVARYQKAHPLKVKKWKRNYYHSLQGNAKSKARVMRYRANKLNASGDFSPEEWLAKKELFGNRCAYCGKKNKHLTVDHWIPLSRGGTNFIENIIPACKSCNSHKKDKNGDDFSFVGKVQMILLLGRNDA